MGGGRPLGAAGGTQCSASSASSSSATSHAAASGGPPGSEDPHLAQAGVQGPGAARPELSD
eukprot:8524914-Alexandrium_andersonii.AAC.1